MFSITEQLSAATKTQLEAQLKIINSFATAAFEGAQQVIALNLSTTKASVEKSSATARELLEAKDPQEFFALSTARTPNFDGVFAYGRELFSIASKTQAELFQSAKEQLKEAGQQVPKVALKLAPAPSAPAPATAPVTAPVAAAVEEAVTAAVTPEPAPAAPPVVMAASAPVEAPAPAPKAAAPKTEAKAKPAASFPEHKASNGTGKQLDILPPTPKSKK